MSKPSEERRCPVKCVNCGDIMAASVLPDGSIVPIGIGDDGKCGNAEYVVLGSPDSGTTEGGT